VIDGRAVRRGGHVRVVRFGDGVFVTRQLGPDATTHVEADSARLSRYDLLVRTSLALDVRLQADVVLRTLVQLLVPEFVDACEIDIVEGDQLRRIVAAAGPGPDALSHRETEPLALDATHPIAAVVRSGVPVYVQSDSPDADFYFGPEGQKYTARAMGLTTIAIIPLQGRRGTLGALSIGIGPSGRLLGPDDMEVLGVVGRRISANIENAQLYENVRQQSITLQRALLPDELPDGDWFELAGRYRPGTSDDEVGGDWYDAHPLETSELAFTIGDVAGRGIGAAAVMGQLRSSIAALQGDRHSPADVLDRVGRLRLRPQTLATVLCGSLAIDGRLRYASAGHPPPLLMSDGRATLLTTHPAPPVGTGVHTAITTHQFFLSRGDTIVMYTDGLVERREVGIDAGLQRLATAAAPLHDASASDIADALLHAMVADEISDDVAILVLRFG
jgi:GAF domain-containing protein